MNVWTEAAFLLESQAGSIIRILGMHKNWAEAFHRRFGQQAFTIAKLTTRIVSNSTPMGQAWSEDPIPNLANADEMTRAKQMDKEMFYVVGMIVQTLNVKDEEQLVQMLRKSPEIAKKINDMKGGMNAAMEIERLFADALSNLYAQKPKPEDVFIDLGKGWYWENLRTSNCEPESQMMGHCGMDDRGILYSLRDPNNRPHVTLTYDETKNTVHQIKGKQNALPAEKYWPAIQAFFEKTQARLADPSTRGSELGQVLSQYFPQPESETPTVCQTEGGSWEFTQDPDLFFLILDEPLADDEGNPGNVLPEAQIIHHDHGSFLVVLEPPITETQMDDLYTGLMDKLEEDPQRYDLYRDLFPSERAYKSHVNRLFGRQESIRLEHARMMGPVAYAEALAEVFLHEDSRGNIVRLLGVNRIWADFFHKELGKFAFPFAKWMIAASAKAYGQNIFKLDPSQAPVGLPPDFDEEARGRLEPYLAQMGQEDAALASMLLTKGAFGTLPPWEPIEEATKLLNASPKMVSALNSTQKLDLNTIGALKSEAIEQIEKNQNLSSLGQTVLRLAGGYEWRTVDDEEFYGMGPALGNCGEGTGDQMYVLFDGQGRVHAAASYDPQNGLDQIVGHGNAPPKQKYKSMVLALAQHLKTGLARGEKSWGASFGESLRHSQDVHEEQVGAFVGYHGSQRPIASLKPVMDAARAADFGPGMYFTTDPNDAKTYGPNVYRATLDCKNPLRIQAAKTPEMARVQKALKITDEDLQFADEGVWHAMMGLAGTLVEIGQISWLGLINFLKKMGHDGILIPNDVVVDARGNNHAKGDYIIIFDESQVKGWTQNESIVREFLTDLTPSRKEAKRILKDVISNNWDLLVKRGVDPDGLKYLGTGNNGTAWQLADGRVLKITTDDAEAKLAAHIRGRRFKHVFTIFDVWAFPGQVNGHHIYGLVTEGGLQKPSQEDQDAFDQMAATLLQVEQDSGRQIESDLRNVLRYLMADPDVEPSQKRQTLEAIKRFDVPGMMSDMKKIGVPADLHSGNFMQRQDGTFVIIDIGTGGNDEDDTPVFVKDEEVVEAPQRFTEGRKKFPCKRCGGIDWNDHRYGVGDCCVAELTGRQEESLDLDGRLDEVGILGAPQAGSGSQMRGMGSTAWSGGKLVLADPEDHVPVDEEDQEAQYLDQDSKTLGPNGAGSPY